MAHRPYRVRVARTRQISPHFQRITLHGVEDVGPKDIIRDVRIKVIVPAGGALPDLPEEDWFTTWKTLDSETRGHARTYSIRAFRRNLPGNAPDELDIDFVLHPEAAGPASTWAANAKAGDELLIIAPPRDDDSGVGIEFAPGSSSHVVMLGDETALPAIAKTLEEWPEGVSGSVFIEIPCAEDAQELEVPPGVSVQWLARGAMMNGEMHGESAHAEPGELLCQCLQQIVVEASGENTGGISPGRHAGVLGQNPARRHADTAETRGETVSNLGRGGGGLGGRGRGGGGRGDDYESELAIWETPSFSRAGEPLKAVDAAENCEHNALTISSKGEVRAERTSSNSAFTPSWRLFANTYFWIAGESSAVVRMRKILVKDHGVPRQQVSFMGYWKRGKSLQG